ncbi:hypothetical protein ScPMuIL_015736 [Solemya velum]
MNLKKLLTDFNNAEQVPHFTVLDVCQNFKKTNGVESQLDIVSGRLEYARKELEKINEFVLDIITDQFKTEAFSDATRVKFSRETRLPEN